MLSDPGWAQQPVEIAGTRGRLRRIAFEWGLSFASGILLAVAFLILPSLVRALLAPFVLVPWIVLFARPGAGAPAWLILPGAYLFAVLAGAGLVAASPAAGLIAPLTFVPFLLPFSALLHRMPDGGRIPAWFVVPFAWVGCEWIRCTYSPGNLEIYLLAHAVSDITPLIQVADLIGSYGVSWIVAGANTIVAWEVIGWMDRSRGRPTAEGTSSARWIGGARAWRLGVLGAPIILSFLYGGVTLASLEMRPGLRVFAVRLDRESRTPDDPREQEKRYVEMTYRGIPMEAEVDLIVWPREAIPDVLLYDEEYFWDLERLGNRFRCPLLIGARGYSTWSLDTFRSVAAHITAAGKPARVYEQLRLVPGLERAPLEMQLRRLVPKWEDGARGLVSGWLGSFPPIQTGSDLLVFDLDEDLSVGGPLGLEVMSHRWCREAKEKGAALLVSLDHRRWETGSTFEVALMAATFRAIENRIPVLRVEDGGGCFLIDPAGRLIRSSAAPEEDGQAFRAEMTVLGNPRAGSSEGGEILGRLMAALVLVLLGWVLMRKPPGT